VRIWRWRGKAELLHVLPAGSQIHSVGISDDGKLLAAGCEFGAVQVWNLETGQEAGPPLAHSGSVRQAVFLPGGAMLASGSREGFKLWNALSQRTVGPTVDFAAQVTDLQVSRDGSTVVLTAGENPQSLHVWGLPNLLRASPEWLAAWVRIKTGSRLSKAGAVSPLTPEELAAAQKELASVEAAPK
jgi:WD40 repeat protein